MCRLLVRPLSRSVTSQGTQLCTVTQTRPQHRSRHRTVTGGILGSPVYYLASHKLDTERRSLFFSDWKMAYPENEVDGGEMQAAGEADWPASHKPRPCCLQPPPLLHIPQGLSLGALLEAQPCMAQRLDSSAHLPQVDLMAAQAHKAGRCEQGHLMDPLHVQGVALLRHDFATCGCCCSASLPESSV